MGIRKEETYEIYVPSITKNREIVSNLKVRRKAQQVFHFLILPKNPLFLSFSTPPELMEAFELMAGEDMGLRPMLDGAGEGTWRTLAALRGGRWFGGGAGG
jgi:hypothetical protein